MQKHIPEEQSQNQQPNKVHMMLQAFQENPYTAPVKKINIDEFNKQLYVNHTNQAQSWQARTKGLTKNYSEMQVPELQQELGQTRRSCDP